MGTGVEHIAHIHVTFNIVSDVASVHILGNGFIKEPFAFAVQSMAQLLQQDKSIAFLAWVLTEGRYIVEDLVHVGQVEVSTKAKVLGPPIVASHEGMDKRKGTLAGG